MKTTFKIINGNLYEYDSNENLIHRKSSDGYESWREYDSNGKVIHSKISNGFEYWYDYDSNGNLIHSKYSNGVENWYDSKGNSITKKQFDKLNQVVTISGRKYHLTLI